MSELATDHLVGQVMRIKNSIIIDADWHNFDVIFKFPHILKGLEQDLDGLVRLLGWSNLATSNPLIILVDSGDDIVLEHLLKK